MIFFFLKFLKWYTIEIVEIILTTTISSFLGSVKKNYVKLIQIWIIFLSIQIKGSLFIKKICPCCKQPCSSVCSDWSPAGKLSFLLSTLIEAFWEFFSSQKLISIPSRLKNCLRSVPFRTQFRPGGLNVFQCPGFFSKTVWTTRACLEIAGALITHFIKVCFLLRAFGRILFFSDQY